MPHVDPETHFVFDIGALCDFAAHVAKKTFEHNGIELTEDDWPMVSRAVEEYINFQLDAIEKRADMQNMASAILADLESLPTTEEE